MKVKTLVSGMLIFSAFFVSTSASAVSVMEMEGLALNQDTAYIESGFSILAPGEHLHSVLDFDEFDTGAQMANDTHGMLLTKADSSKFDFISLFSLNLRGADVRPTSLGGPLSFALQVDGISNGAVQVSKQLFTGVLGTVNFFSEDANWGGLDEVQFWYSSSLGYGNPGGFVGDDFQFDTLTAQVSAVPVPAAAWLFFSAIGALGVVRKKQVTA
mgnify:CR=1 FL=1